MDPFLPSGILAHDMLGQRPTSPVVMHSLDAEKVSSIIADRETISSIFVSFPPQAVERQTWLLVLCKQST